MSGNVASSHDYVYFPAFGDKTQMRLRLQLCLVCLSYSSMANLSTDQSDELASLEAPSTVIEPSNGSGVVSPTGVVPTPEERPSQPNNRRRTASWLRTHVNIYLVLFAGVLFAAAVSGGVLYFRASAPQTNDLSQSLSQQTLDQLSSTDISVGEPKHTLSVQSDTIFSGNVLVRDNLQIAGTLQVGNNLAIAGLRVTGNSIFDDVQVTKSLALTGNEAIQGQLTVQKNLSVNGNGTFLGTLSASSLSVGALQLTGDLNLTHHLSAGGSTPGRSNGSALGSGGTASVSGSDTAGSVTINTGSSPNAGCYITVTFATKFNSTPHVIISPAGSAASTLRYYVNRSTTSFSICSSSIPSGSTTFTFDYIALD